MYIKIYIIYIDEWLERERYVGNKRETYVATYTILYTYKVLIVVRKHFSYVAFVNFFDFSVCRIHVTLDNFTIWCTAIVSALD